MAWSNRKKILDWQSMLDTPVQVELNNKAVYFGRLHTVDPVSISVVLLTSRSLEKESVDQSVTADVVVFPGVNVTNISPYEVTGEAEKNFFNNLNPDVIFSSSPANSWDEAVLAQKKNALVGWFKDNRFPVSVADEDIIVADLVTISKPYNEHACTGTNQVVLSRVKKAIHTFDKKSSDVKKS